MRLSVFSACNKNDGFLPQSAICSGCSHHWPVELIIEIDELDALLFTGRSKDQTSITDPRKTPIGFEILWIHDSIPILLGILYMTCCLLQAHVRLTKLGKSRRRRKTCCGKNCGIDEEVVKSTANRFTMFHRCPVHLAGRVGLTVYDRANATKSLKIQMGPMDFTET